MLSLLVDSKGGAFSSWDAKREVDCGWLHLHDYHHQC